MLPLIGVTTGEYVNPTHPREPVVYGQGATYTAAVAAAGGLPILVPILPQGQELPQLLSILDGLVLGGGEDIAPAHYGQEPSPLLGRVSPARDRHEFELLRLARQAGTPILAICRGLQLLNVSCGGTLYQDLATELPGDVLHGQGTADAEEQTVAHDLRLDPGSRLASTLGPEPLTANTYHHQGIANLGRGLRASAWTADGLVEGIETAGPEFLLGVQCHPESLALTEERWLRLFEALVAASRGVREASAA